MPLKEHVFSLAVRKTRVVLWIGAILVGLAAAFFASSADWAERTRVAVFARFEWLPLVVTPLGIMISVWITRHWVPGARGSGIPQAIAALQNADDDYRLRLLSFRVVFWKLVLSVTGLFCRAFIGREGPTVPIGAALMCRLGRFARFPHHLIEIERGLILAYFTGDGGSGRDGNDGKPADGPAHSRNGVSCVRGFETDLPHKTCTGHWQKTCS